MSSDILTIIGNDTTLKRQTRAELAGPCPFCGGSDRFRVNIDNSTWWCRQCSPDHRWHDKYEYVKKKYNIGYREAKELIDGPQAGGQPQTDPLADYPAAHGCTWADLAAWGARIEPFCDYRRDQPTFGQHFDAIFFPADPYHPNDGRGQWRIFGLDAKFMPAQPGQKDYWYGLKQAAALALATQQPLVVVNGKPSVIACSGAGVAACTLPGGENGMPTRLKKLIKELLAVYPRDKPITVLLDGDKTGRQYAPKVADLIRQNGYTVVVKDPGDGLDAADVAALNKTQAPAAIAALADLGGAQTPPAAASATSAGGGTPQTSSSAGSVAQSNQSAQSRGETKIQHPTTQKDLSLPGGFFLEDEILWKKKVSKKGEDVSFPVYSGKILVSEIGVDVSTNTHTMTVAFGKQQGNYQYITAPRSEFARSGSCVELLASRGATIHDTNGRYITEYLSEFAANNDGSLKTEKQIDRLGLFNDGESLKLPNGVVGCTDDIKYTGHYRLGIGQNPDAYIKALREALTWESDPLLLAIGLSAASPAIGRLRLRRNPVLYMAGDSTSGKSTILQFAIGLWGDPTAAPFRMEANLSTAKSFQQTLEHLDGLTILLDDAHTALNPKQLEDSVYSFANGQSYAIGTPGRKARGGERLSGAMFLAGEATPHFRHRGSSLRVLWLDCEQHPPLGPNALKRTPEGKRRAQILEKAWIEGKGLFGQRIAEAIWADWPGFLATKCSLEADPALIGIDNSGNWAELLACAAAALDVVCQEAQVSRIPNHDTMLNRWAKMLKEGHDQIDPAVDCWERLMSLLGQCDQMSDPLLNVAGAQATIFMLGRDLIALEKPGNNCIYVITTSGALEQTLGASAIRLHGQKWVAEGWVNPGNDGKATYNRSFGGRGAMRTLEIPRDVFENWNGQTRLAQTIP